MFVVDDDISVREPLEPLIRCEGWQPETFAWIGGAFFLLANCLFATFRVAVRRRC
jgi:FixJ family two-component response regulator